MSETVTVSARISPTLRDQLDEIARARRRESGDAVRLADIVREALEEFASREACKPRD